MARQKRDNAYYLRILKREHPVIHAELLAGGFPSASAAFLAAGVRKPPKEIHALKRAWTRASNAERHEFVEWIKARSAAGKAKRLAPSSIATPDGQLTESARKRFRALYPAGSLPTAEILTAAGWPNRFDTSLGRAMATGSRIRKPDLIAKLEIWLPEEEARRKGAR